VRKLSVYQNVAIDLDAIMKLSEDSEWFDAQVGDVRDFSFRRLKQFQEIIFPQIKNYVEDCSDEPLEMESFTLLRYTEGQYFTEHSDEVGGNNRKLSIVIYLNDDYEGGEIYFRKQNLTIKPKANSLVAFPSTEEFVHEAKPIASGTKYIITSFWYSRLEN
jgi:Rps23 Pro-64 3,4-dihydroxylase Tpa1-like proline 4-hydroxylase